MTFTDGSRKSDDVSHWKLRDYPPVSSKRFGTDEAPPPPPTQVFLSLEDPYHPRVTAVATPMGQAYRIQSMSPAVGDRRSRPLLFSAPPLYESSTGPVNSFVAREVSHTAPRDLFHLPQPGDVATTSLRGGVHSVSSLAVTPNEENTTGLQSNVVNSSSPLTPSTFHSVVRDNGQKKLDHWRRHREINRRLPVGSNVLASSAARRSWAEDGAAFPQSFPSRSTSVLSVTSAVDDVDGARHARDDNKFHVKAEWRNPVDSFASQTDFPDDEVTAGRDPQPPMKVPAQRREEYFDPVIVQPSTNVSAGGRNDCAAPHKIASPPLLSASSIEETPDDPVISLNSVISRPVAPRARGSSSTGNIVPGVDAAPPSEGTGRSHSLVSSDPLVSEFLTNVRQQQEDLLKIVLHQQEHISRLEAQRSGDQAVQLSAPVEVRKETVAEARSPVIVEGRAGKTWLPTAATSHDDGSQAANGKLAVRGIQLETRTESSTQAAPVSQTEASTQCIQPASDTVDDIERELRRLDDETTVVLRHRASFETSKAKQHDEIRQKLSRHFALKQQHHQQLRTNFVEQRVEPSRIANTYVFSNAMAPSRTESSLPPERNFYQPVSPPPTHIDSFVQSQTAREVIAAQTNTEQIPKVAQSTMTLNNQTLRDRGCQYDEVPILPPKSDAMELFLQLKQQYLNLRKKNDILVPAEHTKSESWTRI